MTPERDPAIKAILDAYDTDYDTFDAAKAAFDAARAAYHAEVARIIKEYPQ